MNKHHLKKRKSSKYLLGFSFHSKKFLNLFYFRTILPCPIYDIPEFQTYDLKTFTHTVKFKKKSKIKSDTPNENVIEHLTKTEEDDSGTF